MTWLSLCAYLDLFSPLAVAEGILGSSRFLWLIAAPELGRVGRESSRAEKVEFLVLLGSHNPKGTGLDVLTQFQEVEKKYFGN